MARVQVQYDGQGEALRTTAAPKVQAVSARLDPRGSKGFALAEALGALERNLPALDKMREKMETEEKEKAQAWAQSMTVDDLNRAIKEGKMLPSQSPVFAATVQNIAGQNNREGLERDTISKMERGELVFNTPEDLDKFLTGKRNELLQGKSKYEIAGFDKTWGQFRNKIIDANTKLNDKKANDQAVQISTEHLTNTLAKVTAPDFKVEGKDAITDQDRAQEVMKQYGILRNGSVLRDESAKAAWTGMLTEVARSGNKDLLKALLDSRLPNNGPAVRLFIDPNGTAAINLQNIAQSEYDQLQRKNAQTTLDNLVKVEFQQASDAADTLVAGNRGGEIRSVTLSNGTVVKAEELAAGSIQRRIDANPNMPFADQVTLFTRNGVKNPGWERDFKTAVNNIGEVNLDASGKPVGQLLPATMEALDRFAVIRQVSEQYAESLVGEENYKVLRRIQALRDLGTGGDSNQAAALVNQITKRQLPKETWGRITDQVNTSFDEMANPGMFTKRFWGEVFRGEWGNGDKNLIPIKSHVREIAETYLAAGVANSGEQAVQMAADYLSNPGVMTQINNTLYLNKDLPKVPSGEEGKTAEWTMGFMQNVLGERLKARGLPFSMSDLTLIPQEGGQGTFLVALRAQPIPNENNFGFMTVTRKEMENWIKSEIDLRQKRQVREGNDNVRSNFQQPEPDFGIFP